jgi:hypothetical protein
MTIKKSPRRKYFVSLFETTKAGGIKCLGKAMVTPVTPRIYYGSLADLLPSK